MEVNTNVYEKNFRFWEMLQALYPLFKNMVLQMNTLKTVRKNLRKSVKTNQETYLTLVYIVFSNIFSYGTFFSEPTVNISNN